MSELSIEHTTTDVLIIGAGPGGYVAGIRAAQLGLSVVVVDPQPMGGTCLNVGCIPSKAIIHAADEYAAALAKISQPEMGISVAGASLDLAKTMVWKNEIVGRLNDGVAGLLARAGARVIVGRAHLVDGKTAEVSSIVDGREVPVESITAEHVVIATGSAPIELPHLPFGETAFGAVISSTEALALPAVPEKLVVVGGGYIGLELGQAFAKLGSNVTIVEAESRVLSIYDRRLTMAVSRNLTKLGIEVLTGAKAVALADDGLVIEDGESAERRTLLADQVLVTVGRKPQTDGWGLENLGLTMNGRFVAIDDRCHTSMRNVWAIGDVTGEPMLAHRAMKQGEVVAEAIAGQATVFDHRAIPAIVFTDPEIVSVGMSPDEAKEALAGTTVEVTEGRFNLAANGRTMTLRGRGRVRRPTPASSVSSPGPITI